MPSDKDRSIDLANTSRRVARSMTTRSVAERFEAIADDYDRQAEEASDTENLDAQMVETERRHHNGEDAQE